jgi:two-component system KDP operon response regulator KdpE
MVAMRSNIMEHRDRLSGVRVLIVDDVSELRQVIRWILEVEGATVLEAPNGREALRLAQTEPVDVALTDLGLPDMSGEDVVAGLRSVSRGRIPVAVISGAGGAALEHALEVGAERAFAKPVDRDDLVRYLAAARKVAEEWLHRSVLPRRA